MSVCVLLGVAGFQARRFLYIFSERASKTLKKATALLLVRHRQNVSDRNGEATAAY